MLPQPEPRTIDRQARLRAQPQEVPTRPPERRVRNFDEVFLPWTPDMAMREAERCLHCPDAPCVKACPLGNDIPRALWLTEQGEFGEAAQVFEETNNLSDICSRVCPHSEQCESACPHLAEGKAPVAIGRIEGFLADLSRKASGWHAERPPCSRRRVAVVGAGPAGLTVAELLAREGHCITVFEQWPDGGGLLRYGIPRFKLDHALVQHRLDLLHELGVQFVFDTRVGEASGVECLLSDGFEAVFLGTGAERPAPVEIPGEDAAGTYQARAFLVQANVEQNLRPSELEDPPEVGRKVAVVGGGDTAMDCARTALRLGAEEVVCYYRRTEAEMPGNPTDRRLAREEGVGFEWLVSPVRILQDEAGHVRGIRLVRTRLGGVDESGRRRPEVLPGSEFDVNADTVILALGFSPDPDLPLRTPGLEARNGGLLIIDPATGRTTRKGVWAGGDNVRGPSLVAHAVAQARVAARDIHRSLGGEGQEREPPG
jgi:glutamate synthase (NADPH/NADH) small chain